MRALVDLFAQPVPSLVALYQKATSAGPLYAVDNLAALSPGSEQTVSPASTTSNFTAGHGGHNNPWGSPEAPQAPANPFDDERDSTHHPIAAPSDEAANPFDQRLFQQPAATGRPAHALNPFGDDDAAAASAPTDGAHQPARPAAVAVASSAGSAFNPFDSAESEHHHQGRPAPQSPEMLSAPSPEQSPTDILRVLARRGEPVAKDFIRSLRQAEAEGLDRPKRLSLLPSSAPQLAKGGSNFLTKIKSATTKLKSEVDGKVRQMQRKQ